MNKNKYTIKYLPSFYDELEKIVKYISENLKNTKAANKLVDKIENAIYDRLQAPEAFQVYKYSENRTINWYKIRVKNFIVLYIVRNNIMIVAHIFYSKRDISNLI